jgi:hypothetical protein
MGYAKVIHKRKKKEKEELRKNGYKSVQDIEKKDA